MKIKFLQIFFVLIFVSSLYLASAKSVIYNESFYSQEFDKFNTYDKISNADEISDSIIDFFQDKEELYNQFNEKETSHMNDVKILINKANNLLFIFSIILIVIFSVLLFYNKNVNKLIISAGIIGLLLPIPFLLFDFSNLFTKFHLIFFPQGNWQFPLESLLIQLFPKQFFYDAVILIVLKTSIFSILLIILGFYLVNKR
jgi:integral membrane protein (TIGR01906 family)